VRRALAAAIAVVALGCAEPPAPTGLATSADDLFGEHLVPRFELILDDDARASLAARPKDWVRAEFRYAGTTLGDVGVRWKGNRSRQGLDGKPSWKIRFDKFVPKQRFLGQRELVLNNLVEDPTAAREALAYRLYRSAGVPAPRTGWAQLVVDGANLGLYLNLEAIDRGPLKRVFGDDDGTLYEGEFGCDLYPEDAPRFEQDGGDDVGHADLIALAEVARRPDALLAPDGPLDLPRVLGYLAVAAVIGDFDGYRHGHNYRLYRDRDSGRWSLLPWGQDRTFKSRLRLTDSGGLVAKLCFADAPCRATFALAVVAAAARLDALIRDGTLDRWFILIDAAGRVDPRRPADADEVADARAALRRFVAERPAEIRAELACLGPTPPASCAPPTAPCVPTTVGATTFALCPTPRTWDDAAAACRQDGLQLARLDDADQVAAIAEAARAISSERWWIGLSDRTAEGTWAWADGAPVGFTRWRKGQPDDAACGEDCAALRPKGRGTWSDGHCAQRRPYVCR
jgi:hypothetical protein